MAYSTGPTGSYRGNYPFTTVTALLWSDVDRLGDVGLPRGQLAHPELEGL